MLCGLIIRDIVLIRHLELNFTMGLSVLSGETGAGKSILLDSLSLALGSRGDGGLVRMGCENGEVSAIFRIPSSHSVVSLLESHDIPLSDELVLRRVQNSDGRTRAYVNDTPVGVALLARIGSHLVEIHGQHDDRALMDPSGHRDLVDSFGELQEFLLRVSQSHSAWRDCTRELESARRKVSEIAKDGEYLRECVSELSTLDPRAGEEEQLATRRKAMMESESVVSDISTALSNLSNSKGPFTSLSKIIRTLELKSSEILKPALELLHSSQSSLSDAQEALQKSLNLCEFEPHELESAEERLFALRAASRKFRVPVDELSAHREKLESDLATLEGGENNLTLLEAEVEKKYKVLRECADELSAQRKQASLKLQERVMSQLTPLKLENAEFYVHHDCVEDEIGSHGYDNMEFYVRTNISTNAGPMMKVASGGELSRFLLALKVSLVDGTASSSLLSPALCLVFDEIDTGAGGAVADAIGMRLKELSTGVQVLSVTHAPQVAAQADDHFLIVKSDIDNSTQTFVSLLSPDSRKEEIARMISGAKISDAARHAARHLLSESASG